MSAPDLQPGLPTICRDANRLLLAVEQCVRNFPRYHKYQVGADLRPRSSGHVGSADPQHVQTQPLTTNHYPLKTTNNGLCQRVVVGGRSTGAKGRGKSLFSIFARRKSL